MSGRQNCSQKHAYLPINMKTQKTTIKFFFNMNSFAVHVCRHTKVGSLNVTRELPTYPSPKLTLTLTSHLGQNVGLGEG